MWFRVCVTISVIVPHLFLFVYTFTRLPWAYWTDRVAALILFGGVGLFCIGMTTMVVLKGQTELGPLPILGPLLGAGSILFGTWIFFQPFPFRIEIDEQELRVIHRPKKTVIIPRSDIIRATLVGPTRGRNGAVLYRKDGKKVSQVIGFGYRSDADGTVYPQMSVCAEINRILNIK